MAIDTITQIALGAAVGEAVLGKKVGNKAMLWGAVGGTIPDLDVLVNPFISGVAQLGFHRGFSHSFVFAILFAPVFGWLIYKYYRGAGARWRDWSWLAFWSIVTHPILDWFTMYGTQLLQPFSDYPAAIGSIFIIDPVYTIPLIIAAFWIRRLPNDAKLRRKINIASLAFTTGYLLLGVAIKFHVEATFADSLKAQNIKYERIFSNPTPFNIILWMAIADDGDGQWVGLYSLLDDDDNIRFQYVPKNEAQISAAIDQPALQKLLWFSRGFYTITQSDNTLYFNDIRFGRSDMWLDDKGSYIFSFRLIEDSQPPAMYRDIERQTPGFDARAENFARLFKRISGDKSVEQSSAGKMSSNTKND